MSEVFCLIPKAMAKTAFGNYLNDLTSLPTGGFDLRILAPCTILHLLIGIVVSDVCKIKNTLVIWT
jgi:hypothetical protein